MSTSPFAPGGAPTATSTPACLQISPTEAYRDAILKELSARKGQFEGRQLVSIYFGGGTPGLWRPDCVKDVIDAIKRDWPLMNDPVDVELADSLYGPKSPALEVSLEINPRAAPAELLAALLDAGVNRLSVGVQTFDEGYLSRLGRDHSVTQSLATLKSAGEVGFRRLSFDLLFGGPHQEREGFERDLSIAAKFEVADHISAYSLIVEPGTPFARLEARGQLNASDEDTVADMLFRCEDVLEQAGYAHYEISNFTRPGRWARHNSLYWTGAEYMGLGVGAHELSLSSAGVPMRRAGALKFRDYMADPAGSAQEIERLEEETHLAERVFLGLRTRFGVAWSELEAQFGVHRVKKIRAKVSALESEGWVKTAGPAVGLPSYLVGRGERVVPTLEGLRFANRVALALL